MFQKLEAWTLMFHFILSLAIVGAYLTTVLLGVPDPTLQNASLLVVGYWFGAVGGKKALDMIQNRKGENK